MSDKTFLKIRSLYLLEGEGSSAGDGGTGSDGATGVPAGVPGQQKGSKNPQPEVLYGVQPQAETPGEASKDGGEDRSAAFESLIKGEYKDLYDAKIQSTIQKRLKSTQETVDKYNSLAPTLEFLAKRYGVDPTDQQALIQAIEDDDSYYEEEAMEKGMDVSQLKAVRKLERENETLKQQMQEAQIKENADQIMSGWMQEAQAVKQIYPQFDLQTELQDEKFIGLLRSHVDVRTAYEVVHKDEIISGAMQFAVQQTEQKLSNRIRSGQRPAENGTNSQSSPIVKSDVSQLTKADRAKVAQIVANGGRVSFS